MFLRFATVLRFLALLSLKLAPLFTLFADAIYAI